MTERDQTTESEASYDTTKVATNVSLYLSLTSLSSIISSYLGGYLIGIVGTTQKMFLLSSVLPVMTLFVLRLAESSSSDMS